LRYSPTTDFRVTLPDDQVRWLRVRARSNPDDRTPPNQLSGIFIDVTDQKTAEAEAAQQRQELAHLMRVSVLGELSGALAHELNQPLTAILSNAQAALNLLAEKSPDLVEVREAIHDIVAEDSRAGDIIERLRNLLRKGERKTELVDINELVQSTVALLKSELIGRHIEVETVFASGLPEILGDPVQLQQVLLNLFMNAMDAMASTPNALRRITASTQAGQAEGVEVLIRDRGSGIKPEVGDQLFNPFYTSKPHGLGLGLAFTGRLKRPKHEDFRTVKRADPKPEIQPAQPCEPDPQWIGLPSWPSSVRGAP
jgi:C4-dicarboxylate-specific signal transduction histidine kinase